MSTRLPLLFEEPDAGEGGAGPSRPDKAPDALRTIGEVATALGVRQHVLRYWEEQFPMLRPLKRSGSRRYYRPEDVALVGAIHRMVHVEGYTLRGARQALEAQGAPELASTHRAVDSRADDPVSPVAGVPAQSLGHRLRAIRSHLKAALAE